MTFDVKKIISQNLSIILARKGWSQAGLAKRAGVEKKQISVWITGKHKISSANIQKISKALGVPVEQLTTSSEPASSSPVQDVVAEDTRLKLIIQYLEKIIGLLETPLAGEKEKLIDGGQRTPSPERKMGQD